MADNYTYFSVRYDSLGLVPISYKITVYSPRIFGLFPQTISSVSYPTCSDIEYTIETNKVFFSEDFPRSAIKIKGLNKAPMNINQGSSGSFGSSVIIRCEKCNINQKNKCCDNEITSCHETQQCHSINPGIFVGDEQV